MHATYPNLNQAKKANLNTNGEPETKPLRTRVEENGKNMGGKHEYKQEEMKSCIKRWNRVLGRAKMEEDRGEIFGKIKMGKAVSKPRNGQHC